MCYTYVAVVPTVLAMPYLVTIAGAWSKRPRAVWRPFVLVSLAAASALALFGSPLVVPDGLPLRLPQTDPMGLGPDPMLHVTFVAINALLSAGLGLLPLAGANAFTTLRGRAAQTNA
ncbi:MAG: hypothetical protein AAF333_07270 [Planctomycetota bacterium]